MRCEDVTVQAAAAVQQSILYKRLINVFDVSAADHCTAATAWFVTTIQEFLDAAIYLFLIINLTCIAPHFLIMHLMHLLHQSTYILVT